MDKPLVTVLMPVYNAEKFLAEAIESILHQTLQKFEFVIIDDCSTDGSAEIIKSYDDARIRYSRNDQNLGITKSLNKGIQCACADLIARMDADDISKPNRLQKQYDYLELHPDCALVSSQANVITSNKELIYTDTTPSEYYYFKLTFTSPFFHSSVMYRKDAVKSVGMYTVPYAEDFELFWQLSRNYKIYNLAEVLLDYRVTDGSLFHSTKKVEYAEAVNHQCLRNIHFYTGESFLIRESHLKCLQFEYDLLLKEKSVTSILKCLNVLDYITYCIIRTDNVNRNIPAIQKASIQKRDDIIEYFLSKLPYHQKVLLLLRLRQVTNLAKLFRNTVDVRIKRSFRRK